MIVLEMKELSSWLRWHQGERLLLISSRAEGGMDVGCLRQAIEEATRPSEVGRALQRCLNPTPSYL